jgi:ligand-binding sensor domain-containing protein
MNCKLLIVTLTLSICAYQDDVKFYNINDMFGISIREMASVCKDANGFIWASSKTGILRLTGDDCRIYSLSYRTTDVFDAKLVYKNNTLLAYTNNGQVFHYNALFDGFDFLFHAGLILRNQHLVISSILIDRQEDLWMSTSSGLYKYHSGDLTLIDKGEVLHLTEYDGNHFLYMKNNDIRLMDIGTMNNECLYKNDIPSAFQIASIYYDKTADQLWLGTIFNGLFYCDINDGILSAAPVPSFPKQPVRTIEPYSDSTLLVGIDGQSIWEINK